MYSNLLVGLVAAGFILGTFAVLQIPVHVPVLILGCCGAFLVYQIDRALLASPEDAVNQPARVAWVRRHPVYTVLSSAVAAAAAAAMFPFVRPIVRWVAAIYAVVGVAYAMPMGLHRFRLKAVHLAKPVLTAGGWAVGGVLLPALQAGRELTLPLLLFILYRFGFVFPNPLLADWPDRPGDIQFGIYTPAAYLRGRRLRRIGQTVLAVTLAGSACAAVFSPAPSLLWIDMVGLLFMLGLISRPLPQGRWFYLVTMDVVVAWPAVTAAVYFVG